MITRTCLLAVALSISAASFPGNQASAQQVPPRPAKASAPTSHGKQLVATTVVQSSMVSGLAIKPVKPPVFTAVRPWHPGTGGNGQLNTQPIPPGAGPVDPPR